MNTRSTSQRGLFITFEGIDGCGKTTQVERLAMALGQLGIDSLAIREPGGSRVGEHIRQILIDSGGLRLEPAAELLLFIANRVQNLAEVIKPALAQGKIVISDRHRDSSVAFQGGGRELGIDLVEKLQAEMLDRWPDCTVYLDIPLETSRQRVRQRGTHGQTGQQDRFEREGLDFHERVRSVYHDLIAGDPERFLVIAGDQPIDAVTRELLTKLANRYPDRLAGLELVLADAGPSQ